MSFLHSQVCCIQLDSFPTGACILIFVFSTEFENEFVGRQGSEVKRETTATHNRTQGVHIIAHQQSGSCMRQRLGCATEMKLSFDVC